MKNIRRPPKTDDKKNQVVMPKNSDDNGVLVTEPPRKKSRVSNKQQTQPLTDEDMDDTEYDDKLKKIAEESKKGRTTKVKDYCLYALVSLI